MSASRALARGSHHGPKARRILDRWNETLWRIEPPSDPKRQRKRPIAVFCTDFVHLTNSVLLPQARHITRHSENGNGAVYDDGWVFIALRKANLNWKD